jgi:hypothetical protein
VARSRLRSPRRRSHPWRRFGFTDANGGFTLPNSGTTPVTVQSLMSGQRFVVDNIAGNEETLTLTVTPPGPANWMMPEFVNGSVTLVVPHASTKV